MAYIIMKVLISKLVVLITPPPKFRSCLVMGNDTVNSTRIYDACLFYVLMKEIKYNNAPILYA